VSNTLETNLMSSLFKNYYKMPDGTVKQRNPFTGTQVWAVPGRGIKPITNTIPTSAKKIDRSREGSYCNFCSERYLATPPEKARLIKENGEYVMYEGLNAVEIGTSTAEFRRIPNLFEIVTFDYWAKNHAYELNRETLARKNEYLSTPQGTDHVVNVINYKLMASGHTTEYVQNLGLEVKLKMADAFFGGGHELIVARHHFKPDARYDVELFSSGEMTPEEHYQYFRFTIEAMKDLIANNRYIRYISVFQNWLASAGASFDHLHKQLVSIDEWGAALEHELVLYRNNRNAYNELGANLHSYHNLVFAENDHAIAFAEIGRRYPTIAIYSKSENAMPQDHTPGELRGVSDIVHACHAAMGSQIPCNEEWYYSPIDATENIPWHILIRWRTSNPAGFEGGTSIYVNPISPENLRDKMVPRLFELKNQKKIQEFPIAFECPCRPNSLRYIHGYKDGI
jgi:galactose-1-phosphate uridylyltransferase